MLCVQHYLTTYSNAYVTGNTNSSESDFFPVTVGPDLTYNGGSDAFVAKIGLGPSISSISPSSAVAGAAGFTLTVNGADFMAGAVVRWNGEERVTTFLGDTVLEASIPASDIAVAGTAEVTVFNPLPGGGSSNVVVFNVLVFNPEGGCLNIAGEWGVEETGTLACTLTAEGETETFTDPISGSASVTILQEPGACSFSFNREVPGFGITVRNGEIEGNRLTFSGIAGIPIPGATLTSNNLEATGQVEGDVMNVSASSLLEGTAPAPEAPGGIVNVSCTTTTNAVFSRSAPPPPPAVTPTLPPNSVVNGASFRPATDLGGALAPGSIVAIFGTNLADDLQLATAVPLPTTLGNTSVTFNGISAPLFFVASTQINAQVPFDAMPGEVSAQVKRGSETSTAQTVSVAAVSPGIFALNQQGTGQGAVLIANTAIFAAPSGSIPGKEARPANRLEFISIFTSGLGDVTNRPANGAPPSGGELSTTMATPTVTIGGVNVTPSFSGLTNFVGLYQVNVQVPSNAEGVPNSVAGWDGGLSSYYATSSL